LCTSFAEILCLCWAFKLARSELKCDTDRCVVDTTLEEGVTCLMSDVTCKPVCTCALSLKAGLSQAFTCDRASQPLRGADTRYQRRGSIYQHWQALSKVMQLLCIWRSWSRPVTLLGVGVITMLAAEAEALQVKLTMENGNVVAPTSWA